MYRAFRISFTLLLMLALSSCGSDDSSSPSDDTIPTSGLSAHLVFDGNVADQSGNGNDGTLLGGASIATGALVLGSNDTDAISLPASTMDGLGDFTFAAWLRMDTFRNDNHEVISGANDGDDNELIFWYREHTDEWVFGVSNGGSAFSVDSSIENGEWMHVTLVRSGAMASLYLNGTKLGDSVAVDADLLEIDDGGLIFGQDQDSVGGDFATNESWAGAMDNLRIYNRALSASEVRSLANEER